MVRHILSGASVIFTATLLAQVPSVNYISAVTASSELAGPNVQVFNATFSGQSVQLANFWNGMNKTGISTGVVLTTCDAAYVHNMNCGALAECLQQYQLDSDASDSDLDQINGTSYPKDAAILEFDFISTGNTATFSYVFASNEYPEWVGSNFNDAFGFFISGPGINGPFSNNSINIATIGGAAVSINTVNSFTNANYFIPTPNPGLGQNGDDESTWAFVFDGRTVVMDATIDVQCNATYHAKIAICNTSDHVKQSAIFLKQGTLTSPYAQPGPLTIAPSPVCAGEEITLNVQGDPSWNYTWSTGQSSVGLQTVTTTASLSQNTYSVTAEYLPGCSLATASPAAMLTVHDPINYPPQCLGVNGTGVYAITMQVGEQTCFSIPTNDAANERIFITQSGGESGDGFSSNGAFHATGTFCWTPTSDDIGFHTLETTLSDDNVCGSLSSTCSITIKVVCAFCPVRVYYENRFPGGLPLPALTVAGESITAGHSVDPSQQDGDVTTGDASVEFRAPYISLQPGFYGGPGFLAVADPNTCIEDCNVCCDGWNGFTVDTYGEGTHNVLANVITPNGDGVNDTWQVLDVDHPYCAYGAMAFDLRIFNQWDATVWRLHEDWAEGCCPFRSRAPGYNVVSSIYWDGTANTGDLFCHGCPVSNYVYYYILTLTGCNGQITYTGDISVFGSPGMVPEPPTPFLAEASDDLQEGGITPGILDSAMSTDVSFIESDLMEPAELYLRPNPATDQVWLEYAPGLAKVWLLDATGRRVLERSLQGAPTTILQLVGLAPASYCLVALDSQGMIHNRKLIKQ